MRDSVACCSILPDSIGCGVIISSPGEFSKSGHKRKEFADRHLWSMLPEMRDATSNSTNLLAGKFGHVPYPSTLLCPGHRLLLSGILSSNTFRITPEKFTFDASDGVGMHGCEGHWGLEENRG